MMGPSRPLDLPAALTGRGASGVASAASVTAQCALLCLTEPLDLTASAALLDRAAQLARRTRCLILSLERCDFVDSDGVRTLMRLAGELGSAGKELRLIVAPGTRVDRTLRLLRVEQSLPLYRSLASAWLPTSGQTELPH